MAEDYYKFLSVEASASEREIHEAAKQLANNWSRSRSVGSRPSEKELNALEKIRKANAVLSDPLMRMEHDIEHGYRKHAKSQTKMKKHRVIPLKLSEGNDTFETVKILSDGLDYEKLESIASILTVNPIEVKTEKSNSENESKAEYFKSFDGSGKTESFLYQSCSSEHPGSAVSEVVKSHVNASEDILSSNNLQISSNQLELGNLHNSETSAKIKEDKSLSEMKMNSMNDKILSDSAKSEYEKDLSVIESGSKLPSKQTAEALQQEEPKSHLIEEKEKKPIMIKSSIDHEILRVSEEKFLKPLELVSPLTETASKSEVPESKFSKTEEGYLKNDADQVVVDRDTSEISIIKKSAEPIYFMSEKRRFTKKSELADDSISGHSRSIEVIEPIEIHIKNSNDDAIKKLSTTISISVPNSVDLMMLSAESLKSLEKNSSGKQLFLGNIGEKSQISSLEKRIVQPESEIFIISSQSSQEEFSTVDKVTDPSIKKSDPQLINLGITMKDIFRRRKTEIAKPTNFDHIFSKYRTGSVSIHGQDQRKHSERFDNALRLLKEIEEFSPSPTTSSSVATGKISEAETEKSGIISKDKNDDDFEPNYKDVFQESNSEIEPMFQSVHDQRLENSTQDSSSKLLQDQKSLSKDSKLSETNSKWHLYKDRIDSKFPSLPFEEEQKDNGIEITSKIKLSDSSLFRSLCKCLSVDNNEADNEIPIEEKNSEILSRKEAQLTTVTETKVSNKEDSELTSKVPAPLSRNNSKLTPKLSEDQDEKREQRSRRFTCIDPFPMDVSLSSQSTEDDGEEKFQLPMQHVSATTRIGGIELRTEYHFGPDTEFIQVFVEGQLRARITKDREQDVYCNAKKHDKLPPGMDICASTVISANKCVVTTEVTRCGDRESIAVYRNDVLLFRTGNTTLK